MELLMQIWAAMVALFQALAVISLYLVVMHVLTTAGEFRASRRPSNRTETFDADADEIDANREFCSVIVGGRDRWLWEERIECDFQKVRRWIARLGGPNWLWSKRPAFSRADFERLLADWKTWEMPADLAEEMAEDYPEESPEERRNRVFVVDWFYGQYSVERAEDFMNRYTLIERFRADHREALIATPERILQPGGTDPVEPRDRFSPVFLEFILGGFAEPLFSRHVGKHLLVENRTEFRYDQTLAAFRAWLATQGRKYSQ